MEQILGPQIFVRLHGDWRAFQERAVRDALIDEAMHVWVAEAGGRVVAFAAATLYAERAMGEISMLAVDPADQGRGTGTALTEFVTAWLGGAGVRVAMIDTGGDPGHVPRPACVREGGLHADPDRPLLPGSLTRRRLIRHLLTNATGQLGVVLLSNPTVNTVLTAVVLQSCCAGNTGVRHS